MATATADQAIIMIPMTAAQARLAIPALRHVGREIHDQDENGRALIDLAAEIDRRLASRGMTGTTA